MNDSRGSVWRKWDLHIHTPASFHWNGGKLFAEMTPKEQESSVEATVRALHDSDVAVFAIMDYWTFDGYLSIRRFLRTNTAIPFEKTVFPGMELRIEAPVDYRLNIHVVLSNELTDQQLSDFKACLQIRHTGRSLSDEALRDFAVGLDASKRKRHGFREDPGVSDLDWLRLGSQTAEVGNHKTVYAERDSTMKPRFDMPRRYS
jgi:hypothetical protein